MMKKIFLILIIFSFSASICKAQVSLKINGDTSIVLVQGLETQFKSLQKLTVYSSTQGTFLIFEENSTEWIEIKGLIAKYHSSRGTIKYKYKILGYFPTLFVEEEEVIAENEDYLSAKKRIIIKE